MVYGAKMAHFGISNVVVFDRPCCSAKLLAASSVIITRAMPRFDLSVEQKVLRSAPPLAGKTAILALSGGVDSMALAEIIYRWRRRLKLRLVVAHVHHGLCNDHHVNEYRMRAQNLVRKWASDRKLPFVTNVPKETHLHSENELRSFRHNKLKKWLRRFDADILTLAHHRDDLLETQLIRLIRGCGPQGLKAMASFRSPLWRPLLVLSRSEIERYAQFCSLEWIDDPSNENVNTLRNWLRHKWLPHLENKQLGAKSALARSLATLSPEQFTETLGAHVGLRREGLARLSSMHRQNVVAQYLRSLGVKGYSQSHVLEILKRLDSAKKNVTFQMLNLSFHVSPDFLWASRV